MKYLFLILLSFNIFAAVPMPSVDFNIGQNGLFNGKFKGDGSLLTNLPPTVSVRTYGAVGNGTNDDSAAFTAAYDAVKTNGGTIIVPFTTNYYRANLELTNSSVIWLGEGGTVLGSKVLGQAAGFYKGSVIIPADFNKPVLHLGSGRTNEMVRESYVRNIAFVGSVSTTNTFANMGINIDGGAEGITLEHTPVGFFKTNICVGGSTNNSVYATTFYDQSIVMPNGNARDAASNSFIGLYIHAPISGITNANNSFTTHLKFVGASRVYGGQMGYNIVNDGVQADLSGLYSDSFDSTPTVSHQLKLLKSLTGAYTGDPFVKGAILDGGGRQIEVAFNNGVGAEANSPGYYVPNTYVNGYIHYFDGNSQHVEAGLGGIGSQYYQQERQVFFRANYLRIPGDYGDITAGGFSASVNHSASASGGYIINAWQNFEVFTGNSGVDATLKIIGPSNPSITFVRNSGFFESANISMTSNSLAFNPPNGGNSIITGRNFKVDTNGFLIANQVTVTNNIYMGTNGYMTTLSSNLTFIAPQEIFMYTETGLLVAGTNTPSFYLFDRASGSLMTMRSGPTNMFITPPTTNANRGWLTINGNTRFSGAGTLFIPPQMTLLDRSVLTPQEGAMIYQSDNGLGVRHYENGSWKHPLFDNNGDGLVPDITLSTNIPRLNGTNIFNGVSNIVNSILIATNTLNQFYGTFNGPYSTNIAYVNSNQTFTAVQTITNVSNIFAGNGALITALNASSLATGTVPLARLGSNSPTVDKYLSWDNTWQIPDKYLSAQFNGTILTNGGASGSSLGYPLYVIDTDGYNFDLEFSGRMTSVAASGSFTFSFGYGGDVHTITIPATLAMDNQYLIKFKVYRVGANSQYVTVNFSSDAVTKTLAYGLSEVTATATLTFTRGVTPLSDNTCYLYVAKAKISH